MTNGARPYRATGRVFGYPKVRDWLHSSIHLSSGRIEKVAVLCYGSCDSHSEIGLCIFMLLWIVILLLLFGGGGGYYGYRNGHYGGGGMSVISIVLIVMLVYLLMGR